MRLVIFSTTGTETNALNALVPGWSFGNAIQAGANRFYWDAWLDTDGVNTFLRGAIPATVRVEFAWYFGTLAEHRARLATRCSAWDGATFGVAWGRNESVIIDGRSYANTIPGITMTPSGDIVLDYVADGNGINFFTLYIDHVENDVLGQVICNRHRQGLDDGAITGDWAGVVIGGQVKGKVDVKVAGFLNRSQVFLGYTLPWSSVTIRELFIHGGADANKGLQGCTVVMGSPSTRQEYDLVNGRPVFRPTNLNGDPYEGMGGTNEKPRQGALGGVNNRAGIRQWGDPPLVVTAPQGGSILKFTIPAGDIILWDKDLTKWEWDIDWDGSDGYLPATCTEWNKSTRSVTLEVKSKAGVPASLPTDKVIRVDGISTEWFGEVNIIGARGADFQPGPSGGAVVALYGIDGGGFYNCAFGNTADYTAGAEYVKNFVFRNVHGAKFIEATFWAKNVRFIGCKVPVVHATPNGRVCKDIFSDSPNAWIQSLNLGAGIHATNPHLQIRRFDNVRMANRLQTAAWSEVPNGTWAAVSVATTPVGE